jgi:PHD/YefM family antitoxin component YafN of YafNO toxin-antitoxin module
MRIQVHAAKATDLRTNARDILEQTRWHAQSFEVMVHGKPAAIMMPVELFEEWARALNVVIIRPDSEINPAPAGDAGRK